MEEIEKVFENIKFATESDRLKAIFNVNEFVRTPFISNQFKIHVDTINKQQEIITGLTEKIEELENQLIEINERDC